MENWGFEKKLEESNNKLATTFNDSGIYYTYFTSVGNSIASGYSMCRSTRPLLLRNESLVNIMDTHNICAKIYNFARCQNNNDEHIFEWLVSNISQNDINRINISDYANTNTSMKTRGLSEEDVKRIYTINSANEIGFSDIVLSSNSNLANIVVYNGCTGSFLDNITRNGNHSFFDGFKRDITSIESILKYIQSNNRNKGSNTEVYLCGIPNLFGLNLTSLINKSLRKLSNNYANVIYVPSVSTKGIYPLLGDYNDKSLLDKIKSYGIDIHYDEEEYLRINDNIITSINDNYAMTRAMIELDRILYEFSKDIEFNNPDLVGNRKYILASLEQILLDITNIYISEQKKKEFLSLARKYILNRFANDFYYIGKKNIQECIDSKIKIKL